MMQLTKQTTFATSRAPALRTSAVPRPTTRRTVVVRAVDGEKPQETPAPAPVEPPSLGSTPHGMPPLDPKPPTEKAADNFDGVMAFSGIGPEVINGRLAMVGFVAAVAAELSSGEPVLVQWAEAPLAVAGTFLLVIAGSLIPLLQGDKNTQPVGPLTPSAEMTNGRAAMIGFAALLIGEFLMSGRPLF